MNLGTFVGKVFARTKRIAAGDRFHVLDALEETQRTLRRERFWFNEQWTEMTLGGELTPRDTVGDGVAGYPSDFLRIISAKAPGYKKPIRGVSPSFLREQQGHPQHSNYPKFIAYENKMILVHPISEGTIQLLYVKDIGTVVQVYNNGVKEPRLVDYKQPGSLGLDVLDDSYTNDWFVEALDLYIETTLYHLWMGIYANTAKAQRAMLVAGNIKKTMRRYNTAHQETAPVKAWT